MGMRTQVKIEPTNVYLYGHWSSSTIVQDVHVALSKKWRWTDPEYLARIVFDEMNHEPLTELNYGIGTTMHSDLDSLIVLNTDEQFIEIHLHDNKNVSLYADTFENFVNENLLDVLNHIKEVEYANKS